MIKVEINKELVQKVAQNARLKLTEEELKKFTPQIEEIIIKSFNKLDEIDAKEEPSFQPIEQKNKLRADVVKESLSQIGALKNVKEELKENGYIKGPRVV